MSWKNHDTYDTNDTSHHCHRLNCLDSCGCEPYMYSEQKNCPTKGKISLVRQIAAQITKVNLWEISITKVGILSFVVPNNKHLAPFVKFILTLRWDPLMGWFCTPLNWLYTYISHDWTSSMMPTGLLPYMGPPQCNYTPSQCAQWNTVKYAYFASTR